MTQPEIYIGFTPSLASGHGNHQQAGRYIWEGVKAAADPTMFPEQLRGEHALRTWQVKKVFSGGSVEPRPEPGTTFPSPHCTTGFVPAAPNAVAGVWTGYDSPYDWPAGNVQGKPAGTPKSWAQVAAEGARAYPTQSRTMFMGTQAPGCSRFAQTDAFVPFQPNTKTHAARPRRGDPLRRGQEGPGRPAARARSSTSSCPTSSSRPARRSRPPSTCAPARARCPRGTVELTAPDGWRVDRVKKKVGPISAHRDATVTFDVTPAGDAPGNADVRLSALLRTGRKTGYTDTAVRVVSPVEGRFQRWGKWEEYDNWLTNTAPRARRIGRSAAAQSMGDRRDDHGPGRRAQLVRRSRRAATVALDAAGELHGRRGVEAVRPLAPGADATVEFELTNTHASLPADADVDDPDPHDLQRARRRRAARDLTIVARPDDDDPRGGAAPQVDGGRGRGRVRRPGARRRQALGGRGTCAAPGVGTADGASTYAKVTRQRRRPLLLRPRPRRLPELRGDAGASASRTGSPTRSSC